MPVERTAQGPQNLKYDRNPPQGLACKGKKVRGHDSAWGYPSVPDNPRAKTSSLNGQADYQQHGGKPREAMPNMHTLG